MVCAGGASLKGRVEKLKAAKVAEAQSGLMTEVASVVQPAAVAAPSASEAEVARPKEKCYQTDAVPDPSVAAQCDIPKTRRGKSVATSPACGSTGKLVEGIRSSSPRERRSRSPRSWSSSGLTTKVSDILPASLRAHRKMGLSTVRRPMSDLPSQSAKPWSFAPPRPAQAG
mmetsp:Transcript_94019/g.251733  ORF Transcript_94019/g.251733 Transcript_94019/m.251733 type:complete len:171 (-) Transcript_94019:64-576(-)